MLQPSLGLAARGIARAGDSGDRHGGWARIIDEDDDAADLQRARHHHGAEAEVAQPDLPRLLGLREVLLFVEPLLRARRRRDLPARRHAAAGAT